jgi:hypothetical protein
MKYKRIDSALHNFAHSFTSLMNYVDGAFTLDELAERVRKEPHFVAVNFSTGEVLPNDALTERLQKSISYWKTGLAEQLLSEQVDLHRLSNIVLRYSLTPRGFETSIGALDDRGVQHSVRVESTL